MTIPTTLIFSALLALGIAGVYGYVGWRLGRRRVPSPEANLAWRFFMLWWYSLAATTLIGGVLTLSGALGWTSLPFFVAMTYVNLLAVCTALLGLLYYLVYLFTGNRRWLGRLIAIYIGYYVLLVYYITVSGPNRVDVGRWSVRVGYAEPLVGPVYNFVVLLLILPEIAGALAYFTLFFRVRDVTQRYRIALVSWSIIVWFGSSLAASLGGLAQQDGWQIVSRLIGLTATLGILMAYVPADWIKRRLRVTAIDEPAGMPVP